MASAMRSRAPGVVGCAALGGMLHFVGQHARDVLPEGVVPKFVHDGAFDPAAGAVVGALCSFWYPFVESSAIRISKRLGNGVLSAGVNGIPVKTLLDQLPAWGLSAVGGSFILVSALATEMALVQIHGFAFSNGDRRPQDFSAPPASLGSSGSEEQFNESKDGEPKTSPIGVLQAAAEAQRVATGSHNKNQPLPVWGPHDFSSHPNYKLLQEKALSEGFDGDAPSAMKVDVSMVQPSGELGLQKLLDARQDASRWWYSVASSPAWPMGLLLSAVNFALIPPAFRATFGIYQYTIMRMANHMPYESEHTASLPR